MVLVWMPRLLLDFRLCLAGGPVGGESTPVP